MDYNTHLAGVGGDATLYRTDLQGGLFLGTGAGYKIYFNIYALRLTIILNNSNPAKPPATWATI